MKCAPGDPVSGYAALTAAGFSVDGVSQASGFLCRINGRPTSAADPCVVPSPPWAYWSYWIADRGGAWCYSNAGMLGRDPVRGTVEGWSFVSGSGAAAIHAPRSSTFSRLAGAGTTGVDCDGATTATTTPVTSPPRPPTTQRPPAARPTPPGATNPGTQGGSPGASPPGSVAGVPPPGSAAQQAPSEPGAPVDSEVAGATTSAPGSDATTTSTVDPDTSSTAGASDGEDGTSEQTGPDRGSSGDEEALSTVALAESGRSGSGSPLGMGIGVGGIAALGASAMVVNRRRLRPPDGV